MKIELPYKGHIVAAETDWGEHIGTLDIADVPALDDVAAAVNNALDDPIGMDRQITDLLRPGQSAAVLVSDSFRNTGADHFLPALIDYLNKAGINDASITLLFATGTHRSPTETEQRRILGEQVFQRFQGQIVCHDADDEQGNAYIGATSRGTEVKLNKTALQCDHIIPTGAVVLHYFAGYGGGRKSVVPGIASRETISRNHSRTLDPVQDNINPAVRIGALDDNPVAEDMLEASNLANVAFILNTVLNRDGQIAAVFAGELDAAHRAAARYALDIFSVHIKEKADLVIASCDSTANFLQSHKGLYNAYQAVKPEGRIILLAPCPEGLGSANFDKWIRLKEKDAIIAGLRANAEINGQTALSTCEKAPITVMVTDLCREDVATLGARKAKSLQDALDLVRSEVPTKPTCYIMPSSAYTVPFIP